MTNKRLANAIHSLGKGEVDSSILSSSTIYLAPLEVQTSTRAAPSQRLRPDTKRPFMKRSRSGM